MQTTNLQSLRELRTQEKAIKAGIEDEVRKKKLRKNLHICNFCSNFAP